MIDRATLMTEKRLPVSMGLDTMSAAAIVALMNRQDRQAVDAVAAARHEVAEAAELIANRLAEGGRLVYVGAGSSGRLGVLDAAECPPTFRSHPSQVIGILAGGDDAMFRAREGVEDSADDGAEQIKIRDVSAKDVVCGIAAGGTTPFVHGALAEAKRRGAATVFVTCVEPFAGETAVDVVIRALVGPEVLTGSTRLKAGTATKLILNQLTTAAFVRLGKCYENLMVDFKATNTKLWDRGARIVATVCEIDPAAAMKLMQAAEGDVKVAIVMHQACCDAAKARQRLEACGGQLRPAIHPAGSR